MRLPNRLLSSYSLTCLLCSLPMDVLTPLADPKFFPGNSKQGLRCKTCKVSVHLWCSEEISHQQCPIKTVSGDHTDWHVGE